MEYQLITKQEIENYKGEGGYFYRLTPNGEYFKFKLDDKDLLSFHFEHRWDLEQCLKEYFSEADIKLLNRKLKNNFNPAIDFIHSIVVPGIIKKHRQDLTDYASKQILYRKTYNDNDKNKHLPENNKHNRGQGTIFN